MINNDDAPHSLNAHMFDLSGKFELLHRPHTNDLLNEDCNKKAGEIFCFYSKTRLDLVSDVMKNSVCFMDKELFGHIRNLTQ